jgi:hypothetical protein
MNRFLFSRPLLSVIEQGISSIGLAPRSFATGSPVSPDSLSLEAKEALQRALESLKQGPVTMLKRIASLAIQSAAYRDMHLTSLSIQERMNNGSANPIVTLGEQKPSTSASASSPRPSLFPVQDLTKLPDDDPSVPRQGLKLEQKYMDKTTAWMALQPNHVETSRMLQAGIYLFPPQEATYPTFIDIDAAVKALEYRKSRRRLKLLKFFQRRQDKYQLDVWQHRPGHR